ncbi:beta-lactamase family protein [Leptolyngbya sp. 15MV]|nr:beta-lactamase family protein [Leptolyngbya sp. 15MV]
MRKFLIAAALAALAACASTPVATVRTTQPTTVLPVEQLQVLFWDDATRADRFRRMEDYFAGHEVAAAARTRTLPRGKPYDAALVEEIDRYLASQHAAGIMVLEDGRVRYERYGLGFTPEGRWTSFSVAKSFTSTLLGAAIRDGAIASIDNPVTRYLPALAGTAYDGVTVRQLATMTSGVKWNEDYADPNSDVAKMLQVAPVAGESQAVTYARPLTREAPAGDKWVYKTLETNLLGDLVAAATRRSLADYAKDKIVDPAGFAGDLFWMTDLTGENIGGCCLSLRLDDYARFGQWVLERGQPSVPGGWFGDAGGAAVSFAQQPGFGYGYQWWTYPGEMFGGQGIFGQSITLVPEKGIVVAIVSSWPRATERDRSMARLALVQKIAAAAAAD